MAEQGNNGDEEHVRRIDELVRRMETIPEAESREIAEQLMQAVLALHGAGLERMMELVFESGAAGEGMLRRFAGDALVSSLLVLHGLHPDDLETRVRQAVAKIPGHIDVTSVFDGVVHLRVAGSGGCGSTTPDDETLKDVLRQAVPDVTDIEVRHAAQMSGFVPLLSLSGVPSRMG